MTFWSIENPAEVYEKALYIDSHGLAGASVWALEGDSQNALTSALTAGLEQQDHRPSAFWLTVLPGAKSGLLSGNSPSWRPRGLRLRHSCGRSAATWPAQGMW